jgi:hypothetical protein
MTTYNRNLKIGMGATNTMVDEYDNSNDQYPEFERSVQRWFQAAISGGEKLFTTTAENLYDLYLAYLPYEARQHYTCRACEQFFNNYGNLVTIDENGNIHSAIWGVEGTPRFFQSSVRAMKNAVEKSRVNGVFTSDDKMLGHRITNGWTHLHVQLPVNMLNTDPIETAYQVSAQKYQDFIMLTNALLDYSEDIVRKALTIINSDTLYRSEKVKGVADWFMSVIQSRNGVRNNLNKANIVWSAAASAPTGYTHIRQSMIGTLLDDIRSGLSIESVKSRFKAKVDPMKYQRSQVAPKAGNIAHAERLFMELGYTERTLKRRFARLEELMLEWSPRQLKIGFKKVGRYETGGSATGIFSHIEARDTKKPVEKMNLPETTMTWDKFTRTVLQDALKIEYYVSGKADNYSAITTAMYMDEQPILQWDYEAQRNPFAWYLYNGGSTPSEWGMGIGYREVTGITYQPSMWYEENAHQGKGLFLILQGAKDMRYLGAGNAIFPETLKSVLRPVRSVVEAYSKKETLAGFERSSASGIRLQYGTEWNIRLRVETADSIRVYKIDRWD